jgi:hypothetical protein
MINKDGNTQIIQKDILGTIILTKFQCKSSKEALSNLDQEKYQSLIEKREFATANVMRRF